MLLPRLIFALVLLLISSDALAKEPLQRAHPPSWSQDVLDAFFDDAREQLVGQRPSPTSINTIQLSDVHKDTAPSAEEFRWSDLVDADTLTTEVKKINIALLEVLSKPAVFKGGGNRDCRRDFCMLAVLFRSIANFDEEIRWQKSATTMQRKCQQASDFCNVASDQSYASALKAQQLLGDLLQGQMAGSSDSPNQPIPLPDRPLLMQRMEMAYQESISPSLSGAREFRRKKTDISHEAQLLALLAQVIRHENYEFGDDETYLEYTNQLKEASQSLHRACQDGIYEAARTAAGKISQSCSECHEGYRG